MPSRPRVSWRARYYKTKKPIDWLTVNTALKLVAYEPFDPLSLNISPVDLRAANTQQQGDLLLGVVMSRCVHVLWTIENGRLGDDQVYRRVLDRAGYIFPELLALKAGELPVLPAPPTTEPQPHERASRLALKPELNLGMPRIKPALADLAEVVLVWLDASARAMGMPGLPEIPKPPRTTRKASPIPA